ncbi:MAG: hypothetical protein E7621_06490 [Ruminococcaceae bacterium]|nr:hypothetical protein [Oscillospiraceae bacterium]
MKNNKTVISITICIVSIILIALSLWFFSFNSHNDSSHRDSENIFNTNKTVLPGDEEKIYQSISGVSNDSVKLVPDITHEQVKEMLNTLSPPGSFCWYYTHTLYSSKKSNTTTGILKIDGGNYRIETYNTDGFLMKSIIGEEETVSVQNNSSGAVSEFSSESTSVFIEAGVPDIAKFASESGTDFEYTLVNSIYGTLLFARFESEINGYSQTEEYYISLDYGIVIKADCFENGNVIYSLATTALYEL